MEEMGRWLIGVGLLLAAAGGVLWGASQLGLPLGQLPGDIRIERGGVRLYIPLGSCLAISAFASLLFWLVQRLR
jgi:hypothetical protein